MAEAKTREYLEIEGDVIRVMTLTMTDEKRLTDVLPGLEHRVPVLSPILPRSTVLFYWDESDPKKKRLTLLCESMPGIKNVVKEGYRFKLAMPWTYFFFECVTSGDPNGPTWSITHYKAFQSKNRLTDLDSPLAVAFLPNVDETGRICYGNTATKTNQPLCDRVDTLVNEWYVTLFTDHLLEGREHPRPFAAANWRPWVDATQEYGPTAYLRFPEWDNKRCMRFSPRTLFGLQDNPAKMPEMVFVDAIPDIPMPMTFGRAEEWARQKLSDTQRLRLLTGLQNLQKDEPAMFKVEEPRTEVAAMPNRAEDGGEKIDTGQRDHR